MEPVQNGSEVKEEGLWSAIHNEKGDGYGDALCSAACGVWKVVSEYGSGTTRYKSHSGSVTIVENEDIDAALKRAKREKEEADVLVLECRREFEDADARLRKSIDCFNGEVERAEGAFCKALEGMIENIKLLDLKREKKVVSEEESSEEEEGEFRQQVSVEEKAHEKWRSAQVHCREVVEKNRAFEKAVNIFCNRVISLFDRPFELPSLVDESINSSDQLDSFSLIIDPSKIKARTQKAGRVLDKNRKEVEDAYDLYQKALKARDQAEKNVKRQEAKKKLHEQIHKKTQKLNEISETGVFEEEKPREKEKKDEKKSLFITSSVSSDLCSGDRLKSRRGS